MKNCDRRRQSVLNMLRKTKKLTVEEAMQAFGVSESTVRRLFAQLEAEGEVIRAYGGICFTGRSDGARSYMFDLVQLENADEKNAIGKAAMQLIRNGDIIYLDSGTTVMSLGAAMAEVFRDAAAVGASAETAAEARLLSSCTVFTHSLARRSRSPQGTHEGHPARRRIPRRTARFLRIYHRTRGVGAQIHQMLYRCGRLFRR